MQCYHAEPKAQVLVQKRLASLQKRPISSKEALGYTRTRCCETTRDRTKGSFTEKEPYATAKESYTTTDEPCTTTKEPCISAKKPCFSSAWLCILTGVMMWRAALRRRVGLTRQRLFLLILLGILHRTAGTFILDSPHSKIYIHHICIFLNVCVVCESTLFW